MSSPDVTDQYLVDRAEAIRKKILTRSIRRPHGRINYYFSGHKDVAEIHSVQITREGNFTLVNLNGSTSGFAKFNPTDRKTWTETTRNGKPRIRTQTKYSKEAGFSLALHRAVLKYVTEQTLDRITEIQEERVERVLD